MQSGVAYFHRQNPKDVPADIPEVFRYLGFPSSAAERPAEAARKAVPEETMTLVARSVSQMREALRPNAVYMMFPLRVSPDCASPEDERPSVEFAGRRLESGDLAGNLAACTQVFLVAATIGPQVDAMIRRWAKLDSATAAVMQAVGAMFIESYLDGLNAFLRDEARKSGFELRPRYSPGYGDVPLEVQRIFFSLLPCAQKMSLTLTDSLLMVPEKSVTAFIGMRPLSP